MFTDENEVIVGDEVADESVTVETPDEEVLDDEVDTETE